LQFVKNLNLQSINLSSFSNRLYVYDKKMYNKIESINRRDSLLCLRYRTFKIFARKKFRKCHDI